MCVMTGTRAGIARAGGAALGFHDLLKQLDIEPGRADAASTGGPVEPSVVFILHTPDWEGQDSIAVADRWVLSATLDILKAIAEGKGPTRWIAALGYAGWGPDQLESEMGRHGWFVTPGDAHLLFECDVESRWATAFRQAGIDPRLLVAESGTA